MEVFGDTQTRFGKRLGLTRETISRLERHAEGHQLSPRHLRWLRELRAPPGKAELLQALLAEMEGAIQQEQGMGEPFGGERTEAARGAPGAEQVQLAGQLEEMARRAEAAIQRVEQFLAEQEGLHAEDARRREESVRRAEAAAQRAEQFHREWAARCEEEARRMEEAVQRAETAVRRVEQLGAEEEARRAAWVARRGEEEDQARVTAPRRERVRWRLAASVAVLGVLGVLGGIWFLVGGKASAPPLEVARSKEQENAAVGPSDVAPDLLPEEEPLPQEEMTKGGLDAGTELAQLMASAIPMPKTALPKQLGAPCPELAEEFNGYCWGRVSLTPAQVKAGWCDKLGLYEPSEGWCRAHRAGFRPFLGARSNDNVVDP
jgi:transcriptional regulator with XRE-family HTH domain